MATSAAAPSYRTSSGLRTNLAQTQGAGVSNGPQTPNRSFSPGFSSPSTSLRGDDECLVFEFGSRLMRAGFGGDSTPRCVLTFGPEEQRRVGDFRQWQIGYDRKWRQRKRKHEWSEPHELWRMDLRGVDLGLVEDKVERAVRTAYTKYLLTDSKPRRMLLVLQPALPHGILSALLTTLFTNFHCPSITLISNPVLTTVAAGLRSALVLDLGWHEARVTAVFEFREISSRRSVRGGRMLSQEMGRLLAQEIKRAKGREGSQDTQEDPDVDKAYKNVVSFEECEDLLARLGWCRPQEGSPSFQRRPDAPEGQQTSLQQQSDHTASSTSILDAQNNESLIDINLSSTDPPTTLRLPFSRLSHPAEHTFFPHAPSHPHGPSKPGSDSTVSETQVDAHPFDDEELPPAHLVYETLLSLPIDVRRTCLPRIVIIGGGSDVPGFKSRLVTELQSLIHQKGWDRVRPPTSLSLRPKQGLQRDEAAHSSPSETTTVTAAASGAENGGIPLPPSQQGPIQDQITTMLESRGNTASSPGETEAGGARPRVIETLGPWAGGSLVAGLRVKGAVEIERERYLNSGGLAGASWLKPGDAGPAGGFAGKGEEGKVPKTPARSAALGHAHKTPGGPGGAATGVGGGAAGEKGMGWHLGAWG